MDIKDLRKFKQYLLDKYNKTKDAEYKKMKRQIDKIIQKKVIEENE